MSSDASAPASPESTGLYVVSPAMRRRLQQCYDHGSKLASQDKYDFDYANTLFTECVVNDPNNLIYVEAFLDNLQRKYNNNKKGSRLLGFGGGGSLRKLISKEDWKGVLKQGPEALKANPWDVGTLRAMAEACAAQGYNEVELRYLKNALEANPKDAEVNRHCAQSLARVGQFDQAIVCWHRVEEAKKGDQEAPKAISELTVEKQRIRQGLPRTLGAGMGSAASKAAAYAQAAAKVAPQPKADTAAANESESSEAVESAPRREIPLTPRQQLERAIALDPSEIQPYLKLAELLVADDRLGEAEQLLTKALAISGSDLRIREKLEDVQLERARAQVSVAERRAESEQTDEARELVRQMKSDVNRREIEVLFSRVTRYPQETKLKYDLGLRLKRSGNYAEAIKYLQEARELPGVGAIATLEQGECLQQLKQYAKALDCYDRAAETADSPDCKKLALYRAGVLATGMRELDRAEKSLRELAGLDATYKDVADRLDKIQRIRDKG